MDPFQLRHNFEIMPWIVAIGVGGINTTAITENSLIMLFCSRLTTPSIASSTKVILLERQEAWSVSDVTSRGMVFNCSRMSLDHLTPSTAARRRRLFSARPRKVRTPATSRTPGLSTRPNRT